MMIGGSSITSDNFGGAASGWGNKLAKFSGLGRAARYCAIRI